MSEFDIARLDTLFTPEAPPFALLHRPFSAGHDRVEILVGDCTEVPTLAELPLPEAPAGPGHELVVLVPYRQIAERGFAHRDDDAPLLAMTVREQSTVDARTLLERIPDRPLQLRDEAFDLDDEAYKSVVRTILDEEIGRGEGANFVIKRSFTATVDGPPTDAALTVFRRLLAHESGAYWTFLVHTGTRTLVGATPERHAGLQAGTVMMNPISGTYRHPPAGPTVPDVLRFLADPKETDELYMVVDEELKMMARICEPGVRVVGPHLKEMTRLTHTEYLLTGRSSRDVRDILRETMFVPTVTGSPLENACRVIKRHEAEGRGYYSGVLAVVGRDDSGARQLDSSLLIRTADISADGGLRIGVGATLVRHSDPDSEVAETHAKTAALLDAARGTHTPAGHHADGAPAIAQHPEIRKALAQRNRTLSRFWLEPPGAVEYHREDLAGHSVLVVDAEDTFTAMLGHQLRALGLLVTVRRFDEPYETDDFDLVVIGPGPGDPRDREAPKIAALSRTVHRLIEEHRPFLAVCLGHQVLCRELGLELIRKNPPNQGLQQEIDLFGRRTRVGYYNTFAALCADDRFGDIEVCRDRQSGEIHALRGPRLRSLQFHPESLLTEEGVSILGDELTALLPAAVPVR
ncbi:phenazine biosynthesis protein PhzE [Streptomyces coacervatus]|uniref:anthranilate synthase n=1 Tax=Streptomyces coacervatus TaxID=647381 RepID=A0ABP7H5L1_9ACTN|nr:anthranilate synthase family protein [Streptomyces coacervatus]MDF2267467.1 anthranilate synthase family protein [Streptomyces coacervatus]